MDESNLSERKKLLRRECFAAAKSLTADEKAEASAKICAKLKDLESFQAARRVLAFLPLASEPDLTSLYDSSKTWGFARVIDSDSMEFRQMDDLSDSIEGAFKILEPNPDKCPLFEVEEMDLVIIPGVGFCAETGNRLGRGKGHYDRFLEQFRGYENPPAFIGVCFSNQLCAVEVDDHDIPMDLVISD